MAEVLGKTIFRGSVLMVGATVAARIVGVVVQIILGWILAKEDFGRYGIALSLTAIFHCFHENGIYKLLVQQNNESREWQRAGFLLAYLLSLLSAIGFIVVGMWYARTYDDSLVASLVTVLAFAQILGASAAVYRAKFACDLRFNLISSIMFQVRSINQILMVPFSLLGWGAFSFVLPTLFSRPYEVLWWRRRVASHETVKLRDLFPLPTTAMMKMVGKLKWIAVTGLGVAMIQNGDSLVLAYLDVDKAMIGTYFFGFQLTTVLASLLTTSLTSVFLPTISKVKDDQPRMRLMYLRTLRMISTFTFPVCLAGVFLLGPVIHLVWNSKWDDAILVAQVLLLVFPLRLMTPIGRSFLEARGEWRLVALIIYIDVVGVITAAYAGASMGTLKNIVISVAIWRFTFGILQLFVMPIRLKMSVWQVVAVVARYVSICLVSLLVVARFVGSPFEENENVHFLSAFGSLMVFSLVYLILSGLFSRDDYGEALKVFRKG